jgi:hypothetical protein
MMRVDPVHDRRDFRETIADLGVPWHPAWDAAIPSERRALLRQHRRRFLTATDEGRRRLRAWLDDEVPLPPDLPRQERAAYVAHRVALFGDEAALPVVVAGLLALPDCVMSHAIRTAAFLSVGLSSRGWTASANLTDHQGPRPRIIVLSAEADAGTVQHEAWHVWHAPGCARSWPAPAVTTSGGAGLRQLACADGWLPRIDAAARRDERLAEGGRIAWEPAP